MHPALDPTNNPELAKLQGDAAPADPDYLEPDPGMRTLDPDTQPAAEPEPAPEVHAEPEGFKPYDEYIEGGGDPAFYRGEEAFKQQQQLIQEKRDLKARHNARMDSMEHELANIAASNQAQREADVSALRAEMEAAKAEGDADGVAEAYEKLNARATAAPVRAPASPMPSVLELQARDPRLDPAAAHYDDRYYKQFDALLGQSAGEASARLGRQLTDPEMKTHLDSIHATLNPSAKSASGRADANRQRAPKVSAPGGKGAKKDPLSKMDALTRGAYERWAKDPKKKGLAEKLKANYED